MGRAAKGRAVCFWVIAGTCTAASPACGGGGGTAETQPDLMAQPDSTARPDSMAQPDPTVAVPLAGPVTGRGYFPSEAIWYQDISNAAADGESARVIAGLAAAGGFGTGDMLIDFDLEVLVADDGSPMQSFQRGPGFYDPDCDFGPVPVPHGGALEAEAGYACAGGRDCHLIVHHMPTKTLYEMWRANIAEETFKGGCLAVWDLTRVYPPHGRGLGCTSADAAGFPIAALLFTANEVAAGEIPHAVRFILPNDRIRRAVFVAPATHSTGSTRGGPNTPPFGARLRLRHDFPVDLLPEGGRPVAQALQRYGMFLADGGLKALTAQSDRFTRTKWGTGDRRLLSERDLVLIKVTDFEMIAAGPRLPFTGDCVRAP